MPCYDPETHEYPKRLAAKVNCLTELLCSVCKALPPHIFLRVPNLAVWWASHQILDVKIAAVNAKRERGEPLTSDDLSLLYCQDQ